MATTAKVGGMALWFGDNRYVSTGQQGDNFCFAGQLVPAIFIGLQGTIANLMVLPPGGTSFVINNVPLDPTRQVANTYSVVDLSA